MFGNPEILRYVAILQVAVPNFVQSMVDRMKYIDFDFVFVDEESLFDWAALHKIELNLLVATGRIENYASNPHCIVLGISYIISAQDVLPKGTELWASVELGREGETSHLWRPTKYCLARHQIVHARFHAGFWDTCWGIFVYASRVHLFPLGRRSSGICSVRWQRSNRAYTLLHAVYASLCLELALFSF